MTSEQESILIHNGYIITMDEKRRVLPQGYLTIKSKKIIDVGTQVDKTSLKADIIIDAKGKFVIPGMINAHTHGLASLLRARGAALPPDQEWHQEIKWPFLDRLQPRHAAIATQLTGIECLLSGATTVIDQYYPHENHTANHADAMLASYRDLGIRCGFVRAFHETNEISPAMLHESPTSCLGEIERLLKKWHDPSNRMRIFAGPDNLLFTSLTTPQQVMELLGRYNTVMQSHVAESQEVEEMVRKRHGKGSIELLLQTDVLKPGFQAVHGTILTPSDVDILQTRKTSVIHCPLTNAIYGEGIAPIGFLLSKGVPVGLGTDASGTYNGNDILFTLHMAAYLHRLSTSQPALTGKPTQTNPMFQTPLLTPYQLLRLATIDGARAIGLQNEIGSLETGKSADVVIMNPQAIQLHPIADPLTLIVYYMNHQTIDSVIVDGQILVQEHHLTQIDETAFRNELNQVSQELFA